MLVVAIIGILSAIALPRYSDFILRAKQAEAYTNAQVVKNAQYSFWAAHDCFATTESMPVGNPSSQRQNWTSLPTPGFVPCVTSPVSMETFGFRPGAGPVYYRYVCGALPAIAPNPAEFVCSIEGDLDDDGLFFELIFCSDYDGNGTGMNSPGPSNAACNVTFEWLRVSSGIF